MKIYFDNVLIDEDYYTQCSQTGLLFNENDTFKLGTTVCRSFTIGVDKNAINILRTLCVLAANALKLRMSQRLKKFNRTIEAVNNLVENKISDISNKK